MRRRALLTAILAALTLTVASSVAGTPDREEGDILDNLAAACQKEIDIYCHHVTPGEGRLLACFYAHGDKLSGRCEYGLYTAAGDLEQFAGALTHVAKSCRDDLVEHCGEVEVGEGRVASCLLEHKAQVTETCRQAIDHVGLEVEEKKSEEE